MSAIQARSATSISTRSVRQTTENMAHSGVFMNDLLPNHLCELLSRFRSGHAWPTELGYAMNPRWGILRSRVPGGLPTTTVHLLSWGTRSAGQHNSSSKIGVLSDDRIARVYGRSTLAILVLAGSRLHIARRRSLPRQRRR